MMSQSLCLLFSKIFNMGFKVVDYLKCDSAELNFRILTLFGFWPLYTRIKWLKVLHSIYCFLVSASIISMLFIQILDLYLVRNNVIEFLKSLCSTSGTTICVTKYLLLLNQIDKVLFLHRKLKSFKKSTTEPEHIEILKKADKLIVKVTKSFYGLGIPCCIAWMLYPGLENSKEKKTPFPYRLPTDDWSTPVYEILYTYQAMSMLSFLTNLVSLDIVFFSFIIRINAQYDILINSFKEMKTVLQNSNSQGKLYTLKKTQMIFRKNVIFHQTIIR